MFSLLTVIGSFSCLHAIAAASCAAMLQRQWSSQLRKEIDAIVAEIEGEELEA